MDYEEIVTAYENGSLDITDFAKKLDMAKPLKGRPKYRAIEKSFETYKVSEQITNLLSTCKTGDKADYFENELESILNEYYTNLVNSVREVKAWKYMGLAPAEYSVESFSELSETKKFARIRELMRKYYSFLDVQKVADMRDSFKPSGNYTDEDVKKLGFLNHMYKSFQNKDVREEFFCFKKTFLMSLLNFGKSKKLRIEDYMEEKANSMKTREKRLYSEYKMYLMYFSKEDFRDIIENLSLANKTTKISPTRIIECYSDMSESEAEQRDIKSFEIKLSELEKRYTLMQSLKMKWEKEKAIKEKAELIRKQIEESRKRAEELEERQRKAKEELRKAHEKAEKDRIIGKKEGSTGKLDKTIETQKETVAAREIVKPLIFFWLGKDNNTLTKKLGVRKVNEFFKALSEYEKNTGTRISLFMITNAHQSLTRNRLRELQSKADEYEMPRLVEGALGGYGTFKVDRNGNIIDIAKMSFENREKIKKLLERTLRFSLPTEIIDETEENYLRYEFTDQKDSSINMRYLQAMAGRLLRDEKVKVQPLKFIPYIEKNKAGIDVLLASQYQGLSQLAEYYKSKYYLASGKGFQVNADDMNSFLEKISEDKEER